MGQRELDLSCSAFGINRDDSGRQYLGHNLKPLLLLRGMFTLLFCGSLAGCLTPNGTIYFNDSSLVSQFTGPGALIPSFGNQGTVFSPQMMVNFGSHGLIVDSNRRMLIAGFIPTGTSSGVSTFAVGRFNPDGSLDTTFGPQNNGITTFQYLANSDEKACAIVIDPYDQSIVVGGRSVSGSSGSLSRSIVFEKFDQNGIPTTSSFGPSGSPQLVLNPVSLISDNGDDGSCVSLIAGPYNSSYSNGYVAAFSMPDASSPAHMLLNAVRLGATNAAQPVPNVAPLTFSNANYAYDLELNPGCTPALFTVGGCSATVLGSAYGGTNSMLIWNITIDASSVGSNSFNSIKINDLPGAVDTPRAGAFDPAGNLLVTGYSSLNGGGNGSGHVFFLVRVLAASSFSALDSSFGSLGYAYNPFTTQDSAGFAITFDNQMRILVGGGFTGNGTSLDQVVLRYQPNGFLDQSFGPYQGLITNAVTPQDDVVTGIYYDMTVDRIVTVGFGGGNVNGNNGGNEGGNLTISAYSSD